MDAKDQPDAEGRQTAAQYLQERGFQILDRDWEHPDGRLDIVAVERDTLVVCQLKSHTLMRARPLVSPVRIRLLRGMAVDWLNVHGKRFDRIRIDVIGLHYEGEGGFTIEHIRGVD